jgi:hypothetical protein
VNVRSLLVVVAALTTLSERPARAADAVVPWARSQGNRIDLELDFLSTSVSQTFDDFEGNVSQLGLVLTPVAQLKLLGRLHADIELPLAYGQVSATFVTDLSGGIHAERSTGGFVFGNPTLGAHTSRTLSRDLVVFYGGTFSIPTLFDPDDDTSAALTATKDARAAFDAHRLIEEHVSLRARGGLETRVSPKLVYRGDLGVLLAIPTDHGDTELYVEQGNELGYLFGKKYIGGLRLQEVFTLTDGDKLQTALEPFGVYQPEKSAFYARLGLLVALDRSLGFGFEGGKIATLRLTAGARF